MRVLLSAYSSDSRRGSESLLGYHYARILSERHQVSLITCHPSTVDFAHRLEVLDLGERELNEVGRWDLVTWEIAQWPVARRVIREEAVQLIHRVTPVSNKDATMLAYLKPRLLVGPLLASGQAPPSFDRYIYREVARYKERTPLYRRLRPLDRAASVAARALLAREAHFRKAEVILVGTPQTADALPARHRGKCVSVPGLAVETDLYLPGEPASERTQVLYAGRLTGHKGLELLLRALASIKDDVDFQARIVGRGRPAYESLLREVRAELGLEERVEFVPPVPREQLREMVRSCDVFCFPSLSDTYGVALLEAMSSERACVVADTGGPREIVQEGSGIRIPLESPEQYIRDYGRAIRRLIREPALRRELGGRARELVVSRNRWEVIAGVLHQVYDRLERKG